MSKLLGTSKISIRENKEEKYNLKNIKKKNLTTEFSPKTFRMSEIDRNRLKTLTLSLQEMTEKNLTESKVVRGLIAMYDVIDKEKLLQFICKTT